ncbi:hypothetical protein B0H19DRAFT_1127149 [Mycena capillaripes]|nr:hypothetical protein B0H19DRAFT_1127149 [Mycena capillaripes]
MWYAVRVLHTYHTLFTVSLGEPSLFCTTLYILCSTVAYWSHLGSTIRVYLSFIGLPCLHLWPWSVIERKASLP